MNNLVMEMAKAQLASFDYIEIDLVEHQKEVEILKEKIFDLANQVDDPAEFYDKFTTSGYQEEVMNLVTKISMADISAEPATEENTNHVTEEAKEHLSPLHKIPTVSDFLQQYHTAYETVKALGYKNRTEGAYEDLLSVAEKTENLQEAQLIFEDERLLWNIVAMDFLDIYETLYMATDPCYLHLHKQFGMYAEKYKNAKCDADITYITEKMEYSRTEMAARETSLMNILLALGRAIDSYCLNKLAIWKWETDEHVKSAIGNMETVRVTMPRLLTFIEEQFDLTFDDIIEDEGLRIYLQYPEYSDSLFRVKVFPHHQNFEAYRWILKNEILSDRPTKEILRSSPEKIWWPVFEDSYKKQYEKVYNERIKELNKDVTYFKFEEDLGLKTKDVAQAKEEANEWMEKMEKKV